MKNIKNISLITLFCMGTVTSISALEAKKDKECTVNYKNNIVHFADEHDPHNRLITLNYETMELLKTEKVEGSLNHHSDVMGSVDKANYMMMVPKGSNFVTIRDIKSGDFVKKIRLPFRPRSADAYNTRYNLTLLNSRDRPSAVLIDATSLKLVGKAGFNITCNKPNILAPYRGLYAKSDIKNLKCKTSDFGGDQISGHPIWIDSKTFAILDRSNRVVHIYGIEKQKNQWKTHLVQTLKTDTSLHQLIPESKRVLSNHTFYGMTESTGNSKKISGVYKYKKVGSKLFKSRFKKLEYYATVLTPPPPPNINNNRLTPPPPPNVNNNKLTPPPAPNVNNDRLTPPPPPNINDKLTPPPPPSKYRLFPTLPTFPAFHKKTKIEGINGHNLYMSPNRQYIYAPTGATLVNGKLAPGGVFVLNSQSMRVINFIKTGYGAGHVAFSESKGIAIVTNHKDKFLTAINFKKHRFIKNIPLNFRNEGIFSLTTSHAQHIDKSGNFYYNFWTDGGQFFRVDLNKLQVDKSVETGGIPIQGNFYPSIAVNCNIPLPAKTDGYNEIFPSNLVPPKPPVFSEAAENNGYDGLTNKQYLRRFQNLKK